MVVTGCIDFNVKLWSREGEEVGIFGLASWSINTKITWSSTAKSSDYALKVFQNLEEEADKLREFLAKEKEILDRAKKPGFGGWDICSSEDGLPLRTHKAADKEVSQVMKKCFSPKELTMANSKPIEILMHRRREKMVLVPPKRLPVQCLSPVIPPSRSQSSMSFLSGSSSPTTGPSPSPGKAKR
jgi:ferric iron reductase protein FhuF